MRRRECISLVGGSAAAGPLMARAQQPDKVRRVGVLTNLFKDDPEGRTRDEAFVERLRQLGWNEDRNLRIEERRTGGSAELAPKYSAELVPLPPPLTVTTSTPSLLPFL